MAAAMVPSPFRLEDNRMNILALNGSPRLILPITGGMARSRAFSKAAYAAAAEPEEAVRR